VRELEHLVERAVILSPGPVLQMPLGDLVVASASADAPLPVARGTLRDTERELIRRTLVECRWGVGGPRGAAARLGMRRTTRLARMKTFGLRRPSDEHTSKY